MAYNKHPIIRVKAEPSAADEGWPSIAERIRSFCANGQLRTVICVDCYPGVYSEEITDALRRNIPNLTVLDPRMAMKTQEELERMLARFLTLDRVFGYFAPFLMEEFFLADRLETLRQAVEDAPRNAPVAIVGTGAALVTRGSVLVLADMPRREIQLRYRAGMPNWTSDNPEEDVLRKYKRGFFVEWRTADRHKMALFDLAQFFLDTTTPENPKLVEGQAMRDALEQVTRQPFRVVPFFDPGIWGGQWMRQNFKLSEGPPNYAWGFDCVPEENSLLLQFNEVPVEVPALNVVLRHPKPLLGERVFARFGAEFPIRFDLLDTMGGSNLSLQVHPTTGYIHETFGMPYTQDESYYILAAGPQASVYLGLRDGVSSGSFFSALEAAQRTGEPFEAEQFVNRWPARRHDHFSIPAGTVHCSGAECVVLEISATPYLFTFKLWDWGRLGLDGAPRPVHIEHGRRVLQADRDTSWVKNTLLNIVDPLREGEGWREEKTGLHHLEFIETRRHWFSKAVTHHTAGSFHVINLVEGNSARIESPEGAFKPFVFGFAESVIVPAAIGSYRVIPNQPGFQHATIRASVRCSEMPIRESAANRSWRLSGAGIEHFGAGGSWTVSPLQSPGPGAIVAAVEAVTICASDAKMVRLGAAYPLFNGRDLGRDPICLGHELALCVSRVGRNVPEATRPGMRIGLQPDIYTGGRRQCVGVNLQGGMADYIVLGAEVLQSDEGSMVFTVDQRLSRAAVALLEPLGCLEGAFRHWGRREVKPGGRLVVFCADPRGGWSLDRPLLAGQLDLVGLDEQTWLAAGGSCSGMFRSTDLNTVLADETPIDDLLVLGAPDAALIGRVFDRLISTGTFTWLAETPVPLTVPVDLSHFHYNKLTLRGAQSRHLSAVWTRPGRYEYTPGGRAMVFGASGAMGRMHLLRAIQAIDGPETIVAVARRSDKLEALLMELRPLADQHGCEIVGVAIGSEDDWRTRLSDLAPNGFDDVIVVAPGAVAMQDAVGFVASGGLLIGFAGTKPGETVNLPLGRLVMDGLSITASSGSTVADQQRVMERILQGLIRPESLISAVGGFPAMKQGIKAVIESRFSGKVLILPALDWPLMTIDELFEFRPDLLRLAGPQRTWGKGIEDALLCSPAHERSKPK